MLTIYNCSLGFISNTKTVADGTCGFSIYAAQIFAPTETTLKDPCQAITTLPRVAVSIVTENCFLFYISGRSKKRCFKCP